MKRACLLLILLCTWLPCRSLAQGNATAALDQIAEEQRYRILTSKIMNIEETQALLLQRQNELQQRCESLAREIDKLKDAGARGTIHFATREDLKTLVEKVQEVDRKRQEDRKLIMESIKDLGKVPLAAASEPKHRTPPPETSDPYVYEVKEGNTLQGIIMAYNALFKERGEGSITQTQVLKANPSLKAPAYTVYKGQKLRIPEPAKK